MRKIQWKQRILEVLLCTSLVLQGMPLEVFAVETDNVSKIAENLTEQEVVSSEIESQTEIETDIKMNEIESLTEMEEQEGSLEIKQIYETEKDSKEGEVIEGEESDTDIELKNENEEIMSEDAMLQEGETLSGQCGNNLT